MTPPLRSGQASADLPVLVRTRHDPARSQAALSPAQMEFLRLLAEGLTYAGVAGRLGIAPGSVRNRAYRAYEVLGVSSAIEAFRVLGWLQVPEEAA